ncbi:hypothetical protein HBB16_19470 [Pseudonocardia sp. MCCB 268]|nr:hypothetical protein [Pseudonocardia cytotoxica]
MRAAPAIRRRARPGLAVQAPRRTTSGDVDDSRPSAVADHLRKLIRGRWRPGTAAGGTGTGFRAAQGGQISLREAIKQLRADGYVEVRQGASGPEPPSPNSAAPAENLAGADAGKPARSTTSWTSVSRWRPRPPCSWPPPVRVRPGGAAGNHRHAHTV